MYDYQEDVAEWMRRRELMGGPMSNGVRGGVVSMDMGLGKTLLTLCHVMERRAMMKEKFPTLVVMAKGLLRMWKEEHIKKFFKDGGIRALYYHKDQVGSKRFNEITGDEMRQYDMVLTTYDVCVRAYGLGDHHLRHCRMSQVKPGSTAKPRILDVKHRTSAVFSPQAVGAANLYLMPWNRVVCDESQRWVNPATKTFRAMMGLYGVHRWCLTGTPVRNYETDIWAQLRWCGFDRVTRAKDWIRQRFIDYKCKRFLYVLNYEQAQVTMPPLTEVFHTIEMCPRQHRMYRTILEQLRNALSELMHSQGVTYDYILALFVRLRQVVICPTLLHKTTIKPKSKTNTSTKTSTTITATISAAANAKQLKWLKDNMGGAGIGSPKIKKMAGIVAQRHELGEKTIVFSSYVGALKVAQRALKDRGIRSDLLVGSVSADRRVAIIDAFRHGTDGSGGGGPTALLIQYKVGSEGLNLTCATNVIPLEPWWNNAVHQQGVCRAWRRGQTRPVQVHWILARDTIEERILELCAGKSSMADSYIKHGGHVQADAVGKVTMDKSTLIRLINGGE